MSVSPFHCEQRKELTYFQSNDDLFPGFNQTSRNATKAYLRTQSSWQLFILLRILTPYELAILSPFGPNLHWLVTSILAHWGAAMDERYGGGETAKFLTMYTQKEDVTCVVRYITMYESEFENKFGKLEHPQLSNEGCLRITSVGHAIKVFLGLIMADRIMVVRERSKAARAQAGFLEMVRIIFAFYPSR